MVVAADQAVVRGSPYKSKGSSVSRSPCCIAKRVTVERVDAPVFE
jgi:hypothetical protein